MSTIIKSTDGYDIAYYNNNAVYATAWGAASGDMYSRGNLIVGQIKLTFRVGRSYFWFDTSSLASDLVIVAAKLHIYNRNAVSNYNSNFYIKVQRGIELDANDIPVVHHTPITYGDYDKSLVGGDGGEILASTIPEVEGYFSIDLDEDGISWINKGAGAISKFCLRTDKDIDGVAPTEDINKYLEIRGAFGADESQYPYLEIFTAEVTTQEASSVGIDHAKGNGIAVGDNITERGFGVRLAFSGSLGKAINYSIAGFEGDVSYNISAGRWEGTLVKTITETGSFSAGAFVGDLGRFPIAVASDKLFAAETYDYKAYAIIDGETYYGDYVEFTTNSYPAGQYPDDQVPIVDMIPIEPPTALPVSAEVYQPPINAIEDFGFPSFVYPDFMYPDFMYPDWKFPEFEFPDFKFPYYSLPDFVLPDPAWPEFNYPDFESSLEGSWLGRFYYRKAYTKKDLDGLRKKCRIFQDNSVEYALIINHNARVLQRFLNDMTVYAGADEYNTFRPIIPPQHLNALARKRLSMNDFKAIINNFINNSVDNANNVNNNFQLIRDGLGDYVYTEDESFVDISIRTKVVTDNKPNIEGLTEVIGELNKEMTDNYLVINHNSHVLKSILI